ncbi:MAG: hypothetical protein QXT73_03185 [Candidatus Methanomethylicaceae archaeon]
MVDLDTIPSCVGFFGSPIKPNQCASCPVRNLCAKTANDAIIARLLAIKLELKALKNELKAIAR